MENNSVPQKAITVYNRALELSNKGKNAEALDEYQKAIAIYPSFIAAYNNIGEIHSRSGKRDLAIATYTEGLKIERNHRLLLNLGVEYYNSHNAAEALELFKESVSREPGFFEGIFYIGLVYYNKREYKESEKYLSELIKMDRAHLKANYMLSYIYYEWKEYTKTLECLNNIKTTADDKTFLNKYYGFCYYYLGDYDKAVKYLTTALESQPRYKKLKKYLNSLTYEKKIKEIGDIDKAIKDIESSLIEKEPEFMDVTRLSMLYVFKGENERAEKIVVDYKNRLAS